MSFHEIRFPDDIAYGATGGPEYLTTVVATASGFEQRNVNWAAARGRWNVASGLKNQNQLNALIAFYPCVEPGRRAGSNSVRLYAQSSYLNKTLDDQSTWIVGAAVKVGVMPSSNGAIFQFRDNTGNNQACVCITPSGNVALVRGSSSGTVLATSTNAILANSWNFIETKLTIADSGGTFEARVNGDVWVTYTGDTKYSSTLNTANSLRLSGLPSAVHAWYDDLYICDGTGTTNNTFLGDARVDTILPNGVPIKRG